jgi:hypothetical protein
MGDPRARQQWIETPPTRAGSGQSAARFEMKPGEVLGPVQTLKGGFDQDGNLTTPGTTDASAAAVYTTSAGKFMFVAGDEDQIIRMYKFNATAKEYTFVKGWDVSDNLGLNDYDDKRGKQREVDIEGVARVDNKLYWIGSGSNRGDRFRDAPNRDRIFRTDIEVGTNGQPELNFKGYSRIEAKLIAHVEALRQNDASLPNLAEAAKRGVNPKIAAGYNIEGLTQLPDGSLGISFRASGGANALIVPLTNVDAVVTGTAGERGPQFGTPIQLDLGGRGIRDIVGSTYTEGNTVRHQYLIIAGPAGDATGIGNSDFRLYTWTGNAADRPVMHNANLTGLTPEAIALPEGNTKWDANTEFGLISDNGATMFDNNMEGKSESQAPKDKQSRIDWVRLGAEATDGSVSKDLVETRRQGSLSGSREFAFTATGPRAYFEVLGADRANVDIVVKDAAGNEVGKSSSSTGKNVLNLSNLSEGSRYTVSVAPQAGKDADGYTLSWRV